METSRLLLVFSTIAFVGAVAQAAWTLRAGRWRESRWHLAPMALGFIFQCAFLYLRGEQAGRCPLTNQFEIFIFIGWSIMLLYFLVGEAFRLSLLGVFTAPMLVVFQTAALLAPLDRVSATTRGRVNPWFELHAALALVGYAAFALACITGVMLLVQDRLLKRHRINALFHQLPPIHDLALAIRRMVAIGLLLLSIALAASYRIPRPVPSALHLISWAVWCLYLLILLLMFRHKLSSRQTAWVAVTGFLLPFASLWLLAR